MKVLVVGSGGREHAICTSIRKSPRLTKLYCAPGNAGIAQIAECVPIGVMEFEKIAAFASENAIDLVVVAPDDPLAAGLVNVLNDKGIRAFGPKKNAAILEGRFFIGIEKEKKYMDVAIERTKKAEEDLRIRFFL